MVAQKALEEIMSIPTCHQTQTAQCTDAIIIGNELAIFMSDNSKVVLPAHRLTMDIKTYSMNKPGARDKYIIQTCDFCETSKIANYWTQAENGEKSLSEPVYHCQAHREVARNLAWVLSK